MKRYSGLRLRSQLLLATVAVSIALTATSLWFVRQSIASEVQRQTTDAVHASVQAFSRVQQQQQAELSRTAGMLSELPTLKALMTTQDAATVQDASQPFFQLTGSDVLVLTDPAGRVLGVQATAPGMPSAAAQQFITSALERHQQDGWWQTGNELFRFVLRPIVIGAGAESRTVGYMLLGRRATAAVAQEIGHFSGSEVVLMSGQSIVASTLESAESDQLERSLAEIPEAGSSRELSLAGHPYQLGSVALQTESAQPLRALLLFPLDQTYAFLARLTRIIAVLGLLAVVLGALLVTWISRAITRPLDNLVAGVQALAAGNYAYSIRPRGSAEVAELGNTFLVMREQILDSQRKQLEAERMAALGRAASSISHDLRHHLAALVANAEFLRDARELGYDRDEIYREVQRASEQMTDLIDSLVEVARDRKTLALAPADLVRVIQSAVEGVRMRPEYRDSAIELRVQAAATTTVLDARKLQRAFFNLLLNACEATDPARRQIIISIEATDDSMVCRISDNGSGIPSLVRASLFEPFVSAGKDNGTGLGLTIASKIIRDHEGDIEVEKTSERGTTFRVRLPRYRVAQSAGAAR